MFLKSLTISNDTGVIREIRFHNGINLIVDETKNTGSNETGNNVGKTTILMLIDFCLGGNAKQIYTDPENKKEEYKAVKNFLLDTSVLITLKLKENLTDEASPEICIEKNFLSRKALIRRFNGVQQTEEEFDRALTNSIFPGHYGKKPTFAQIISHNIRYKDLSISNTLKTLSNYTRDEEYETLYLFLLGCKFDQGDIKLELTTKIRLEQAFRNRLERDQTKSAYETALGFIDTEIDYLSQRKSNLNLNSNFESDLDNLNQVRYQINRLSSEIGKLKLRRDLITEAIADLNATVSEIDLRQLELIYSQATSQVTGIQKTFEQLTNFHNRMVAEKIKYISSDLPKLTEQIAEHDLTLENLLLKENALAVAIAHSDSFEELEKIIENLNDLYRKKGEYENIISQLREVDTNLQILTNRLNEIDDALFSEEFEQEVKEQVKKFNKHFATISHALYGEQYALKFDPVTTKRGQRVYKFSSFNTNFSSGKKQGEISCFDIAYTLFADQENIPCLHFLLNDKKELMHDNQLLKIAQLVNSKEIQFVASILKDKLPIELNSDKYFVIKLSQDDKLFRIENEFPKNN